MKGHVTIVTAAHMEFSGGPTDSVEGPGNGCTMIGKASSLLLPASDGPFRKSA